MANLALHLKFVMVEAEGYPQHRSTMSANRLRNSFVLMFLTLACKVEGETHLPKESEFHY